MSELELSRRARKKDETRQRIFREAIRLFRERGFESTTVDEITERADVARGTFFNYFPRKEAVLAFLSEQRLTDLEADASELLADTRPAREKVLEVYARAASAWEEEREFAPYVLDELLRRAFAPVEDIGPRWEDVLVQILEQGQRSGQLRGDIEPRRAVDVLTSVYYSLLFMWVHCKEEANLDLRVELRARLEMVMDGIAVRRAAS